MRIYERANRREYQYVRETEKQYLFRGLHLSVCMCEQVETIRERLQGMIKTNRGMSEVHNEPPD